MDISIGWNNESSKKQLIMNRILRRPMFKMGGSAEGITSGLQPRKKFAFAGTVDAMKNNENTPKADAGMSIMEKLQSLEKTEEGRR